MAVADWPQENWAQWLAWLDVVTVFSATLRADHLPELMSPVRANGPRDTC